VFYAIRRDSFSIMGASTVFGLKWAISRAPGSRLA
jgi:hypothetical protein